MCEYTGWRTSSFSSNGSNCVEVRETDVGTWLRDTKDGSVGPVVHLTRRQWRDFLDAVSRDRSPRAGVPQVCPGVDGARTVEDAATGAVLVFTRGEWSAFRSGVVAGEFGPVGDRPVPAAACGTR